MIKLKSLLSRRLFVVSEDAHSAIHQPANVSFSKEFIEYIKRVENGNKVGYKNGKWYPHKSYEGGLPTIGYGHKIQSTVELEKYKNGVNDAVIDGLLKSDLTQASKIVDDFIHKKYKVNLMLTPIQREMLVDYAFNLGSLSGFTKFVDAVLKNNKLAMKSNYKRYAGGTELHDRNAQFLKKYLS